MMLFPRGDHRGKEAAVMHGRAEPVERLEMFRNRVALVALETVTRAILRQRAHQPVARHLGDDGGRRNRHHDPVAADHGGAFATGGEAVAAVDEDMLRRLGQCGHRTRQRPQ